MSYDFEKYNDGEPFDFRQEKWMEEKTKVFYKHEPTDFYERVF